MVFINSGKAVKDLHGIPINVIVLKTDDEIRECIY